MAAVYSPVGSASPEEGAGSAHHFSAALGDHARAKSLPGTPQRASEAKAGGSAATQAATPPPGSDTLSVVSAIKSAPAPLLAFSEP